MTMIRRAPRAETIVFAVFLLSQVLDGVLTYVGVARFGVAAELNGIVSWYVERFGAGPALLGLKSLACICGVVLYDAGCYRSLAVLAGGHVGVAVIPWLVVLSVSA